MTPKGFTEDELVEQPAIELFGSLKWETLNCYTEFDVPGGSPLGRETKAEVVLVSRLRPALEKLNPHIPAEGIDQAVADLTRDRSAMSLVAANREIYTLVKDGVPVSFPDPKGGDDLIERVRVVDWDVPERNDWLLASQFWVTGELYTKRADLVGFVNGLPLLFLELKASHKNLKDAYDDNLTDYKATIPQLFWFNAFIILSNGSQARVGSVTAEWEHFKDWKKVTSEGEEGVVSLETAIRGTCERSRFLDLVENFILFEEGTHGLIKYVARNHQFLGVNNTIAAMDTAREDHGRLGVFWHTQGSGKSISMVFFSQKVLRKKPGNWTFLVVTDRQELDDQIYKQFARCGVITEPEPQATSGAHLRQLLSEDHRYVFTLIHKFRTEKGEVHPVLNERDDIIVIADEAHRTQYDALALNMRTAIPNASFIAFTGTPLIAGEEETRNVFGDYVSIYNFKESVEDAATVPLYYENRVPELKLTNPSLNEDIYEAVEAAGLDEEQEKKLERTLGREYHLITRDDRLDRVAADLVAHFMGRGFRGKAMVVSIDKATAVRMYDKVQEHWKAYRTQLAKDVAAAEGEEREALEAKLEFMDETDMAVVVSSSQNEIAEMEAKGLDIRPHRKRMNNEDLAEKFKDPADPFRLVFVCAMWMTGFDAPSCSTIYLDKPMRNHTLMQTIARANRVFPSKDSGIIVDYANVFRNLQKALAIYGADPKGRVRKGDLPVQPKAELLEHLKTAMAEATTFCAGLDVDPDAIRDAKGFERVRLLDDAVEAILIDDDTKRHYLLLASTVVRLYRAILPDPLANEIARDVAVFDTIALKIRSFTPVPDISGVMQAVEGVLDRSIATEGYVIKEGPEDGHVIDLSKIDFDALQKRFKEGRKRTEAEKLRAAINRTLQQLVRMNRMRADYLERFQRMIEQYNAGSLNIEAFFQQLIAFAKELNEEEQRSVKEGLSEEELAVFDILTKPEIELTAKERKRVKKVAHDMLVKLKGRKLVLDWRKRQESRAAVRLAIEETLDALPNKFEKPLWQQKCDLVYQHVFESYYGNGKSVYGEAA